MKTLHTSLVIIAAFAACSAFAGPRGKSNPTPVGSRALNAPAAPACASEGEKCCKPVVVQAPCCEAPAKAKAGK